MRWTGVLLIMACAKQPVVAATAELPPNMVAPIPVEADCPPDALVSVIIEGEAPFAFGPTTVATVSVRMTKGRRVDVASTTLVEQHIGPLTQLPIRFCLPEGAFEPVPGNTHRVAAVVRHIHGRSTDGDLISTMSNIIEPPADVTVVVQPYAW